jgi:hypothetical protein
VVYEGEDAYKILIEGTVRSAIFMRNDVSKKLLERETHWLDEAECAEAKLDPVPTAVPLRPDRSAAGTHGTGRTRANGSTRAVGRLGAERSPASVGDCCFARKATATCAAAFTRKG